MNITEAQVIKILTTIDAGLVSGLGQPIPGQMCVEAAICYALGLPHGDDPLCVDPALRLLKIILNDGPWPSAQARAEGLRKLAVLQLGSLGALDSAEFTKRVAMFTVTKLLPRVLRRQNLVAEAEACEKAKNLGEAASAVEATSAAASAVEAASGATWAAEAAAWAASATELAFFAEGIADILIEMKVPGVQWLGLL